MASEIKVDTISEKTSANGVAIDGLTIKDGGITAGNPITEIDQWRLTADFTTDGFITSNLARPNGTAQSYFGTGMTESSGVFTFPSSGYWLVTFQACSKAVNDSYNQFEIYVSANSGTDYDQITETYNGGSSGTNGGTSTSSVVLDITDASTHRVKFRASSLASGSLVFGSADENFTSMTFIRLGGT